MKIAIDIDGTLTVWSRVLGPLSHLLRAAGHDVVLLTGCSTPDPASVNCAGLVASRQIQVAPYSASFREIHVCVGLNSGQVANLKAAYCRDNAVDMLIDDNADYCHAVRRLSPATLVLQVQP